MARYLNYHAFGGYGIEQSYRSLPLVTGIHTHRGLELMLREVKDGNKPDDETMRKIVAQVKQEYFEELSSKGFAKVPDNDMAETVREQMDLIEALLWSWRLTQLDFLVERFDIEAIEEEIPLLITARNEAETYKIDLMTRPDFLAIERNTGKLVVHDFKTLGMLTESFAASFNNSLQMAIGTAAAENAYGTTIGGYYIHGLIKGTRRAEYNTAERAYTGPVRQQSYLVYGYRRDALDGVYKEDWQPQFRYKDGKKQRTLGNAYIKTPAREYPGGIEAWIKSLPFELVNTQTVLIGPYPRQNALINQMLPALAAHEAWWIETLRATSDLSQENYNKVWPDPDFQRDLDKAIPRSYNCIDAYGNTCQFYKLCFKGEGWEKPLENGYVRRVPHHQQELTVQNG